MSNWQPQYASLPAMDVRAPLRPSKKKVNVEIARSKDGLPVPVINGKFLHSRYDPASEARRWVKEKLAKKPGAQLAVVLGMGFAYHLEALKDALPKDAPIVVFEPVSEIVSAYANTVKKNIHGVRLWPSPSPQDVVDAVAEVVTPALINHVLIAGHPPSVETDPGSYSTILNCIHAAVDQIAMSLTTGWGFGFEWIENSVRNLHRLPDLPFLNQIAPALKKSPPAAMVIGAGPSLDTAWETMRQARALTLAVDTALEPMEEHGLSPHLAFLFDSQIENAKLVEKVDAGRINLVTSLEVHPSVFERRWRNLILCSCDAGVLSWLERRANFSAGSLKQGGSVVTAAFDLARQSGCSPIYFSGVDLSFSEKQIYCRGVAYERQASESQTRFNSVEDTLYKMRYARTERTELGRPTQDNLYNYYRWLKDEIGRTSQEVVLLTPAGLLSEFLPADGAARLAAERFPPGFDERLFRERLPPNGFVTYDFLRAAQKEMRRLMDSFLAPDHFSDADRIERALAESGLSDVLDTVVLPAIAVCRYERDKGSTRAALLQELRDRLAAVAKLL